MLVIPGQASQPRALQRRSGVRSRTHLVCILWFIYIYIERERERERGCLHNLKSFHYFLCIKNDSDAAARRLRPKGQGAHFLHFVPKFPRIYTTKCILYIKNAWFYCILFSNSPGVIQQNGFIYIYILKMYNFASPRSAGVRSQATKQ